MNRILIVEDDENMNDILESTLSERNYQVRTAMNCDEALKACGEAEFDLVITDVRLPGVDGVEMLGKIRKVQPHVKSIVITGYASEDTPVRAIRTQVSDYLFKPFSLEYFLRAVERTLHGDTERQSKLAMFGKLFEKFGLSLSRNKDKEIESIVAERQEGFRGLYVGIRSGYLSERAASEMYTKLELLEDRYRRLLNSKAPTVADIEEMKSCYHDVQDRIEDFKAGTAEEAPNPSILPPEQFRALYHAVKDSTISFEELLYAPLLRLTPDSRFETLGELLELKHKLWPDLSGRS